VILIVKTTPYFRSSGLLRRPYMKPEYGKRSAGLHARSASERAHRHRAFISELGRHLRVVTEPDGEQFCPFC
jgi:hypothetical protein